MPGEADQECKNADAEQNQPDRSLVVIGDFHWQRQSNIAGGPKFKCALYLEGVNSGMRAIQPLTFALVSLGSVLSLDAQIDRITGKNFATRSEVLATHGMVCTSVPTATQVGIEILKGGGSAVDAAIAANATLGLMEPVSNGIGGDLFATVYSAKENKLYGINGSGRSPLGLIYEQMKAELAKLNRETIPPLGMLPISVPGCVDAWAELHKKFGKLKLSDDLAPAVRYAEEGFPVTDLIAYYWAFGPRLYKGLPGAFLETYTLDGKGRTPAKGDIRSE